MEQTKRLTIEQQLLAKFIEKLPPVEAAVGYGSGITDQAGKEAEEGLTHQLDFVLVLSKLFMWHWQNFIKNSEIYPFMSRIFYLTAPYLYRLGADISYLPYIKEEDIELAIAYIKAGFISQTDLVNDLNNWKNFYMAGRFQKEIYLLITNLELDEAIARNRKSALIIALILLDKENPNMFDLVHEICKLSYYGDELRKRIEDPYKAEKNARGSFEYLSKQYFDDNLYQTTEKGVIIPNYRAIDDYGLKNLPSNFAKHIAPDKTLSDMNAEELLNFRENIIAFFRKVNTSAGWQMGAKGFLSAGAVRSYRYIKEKRIKKKISEEKGKALILDQDQENLTNK